MDINEHGYLRLSRLELRVTLVKVAKVVGCSCATISLVERNRYLPSTQPIWTRRIAEALQQLAEGITP